MKFARRIAAHMPAPEGEWSGGSKLTDEGRGGGGGRDTVHSSKYCAGVEGGRNNKKSQEPAGLLCVEVFETEGS